MDVKINSIHFNADKKLENYITEKVVKLNNYGGNLIKSEVTLFFQRPVGRNYDSKVVKVKLKSKGYEFFAEKKSESFETATNNVVGALRNQIIKRKEKIQKKN